MGSQAPPLPVHDEHDTLKERVVWSWLLVPGLACEPCTRI